MDEFSGEIIVEAGQSSGRYWADLWHYRGLLYFLTWRDIVVRYKQTVIGVLWALTPAVTTVLVMTLVFGKLARLPASGVPYPVLVLVAALPWQLFSNVLSQGGNSLISNSHLITKVYFPRLVIPFSALLVSFVDFCISSVLLLVLMLIYHVNPGWKILALPFFVVLALLTALGAALGLAALNVKYRDIRYVIPLMIQLGMYISPVGFSSDIVPDRWRFFYSLNPMVGVIDGFRWALLGTGGRLYLPGFYLSLLFIVGLVWAGFSYFRKVEHTFADLI